MSVYAAIDVAVRKQLATDNKLPSPPQTYQETMGGTYGYTATNGATIRSFLIAIAYQLKNDTPSYIFDWNSLDPNTCVNDTVQVLEAAIASATTLARVPATV